MQPQQVALAILHAAASLRVAIIHLSHLSPLYVYLLALCIYFQNATMASTMVSSCVLLWLWHCRLYCPQQHWLQGLSFSSVPHPSHYHHWVKKKTVVNGLDMYDFSLLANRHYLDHTRKLPWLLAWDYDHGDIGLLVVVLWD